MNSISKNLCQWKEQESLFMHFFKTVFLLTFLANSANAAVWLVDPTITVSQEYSDNYRLVTDSSFEDEVWTTKLLGQLELKGKSERLDVRALLRLDAIKYSGDDRDLDDRNNQLVRLNSGYRVTERNMFRLRGNLLRDSFLRTTQIVVPPQDIGNDEALEPVDDVDINLIRENVRRTAWNIRPRWDYILNERTTLGLEYRYFDLSFSGDTASSLVESHRQIIEANLARNVTEKDRVNFKIGEAYLRPDNGNDVDTLEALLEWTHDFSESFQMDLGLGGRDSDFKFDTAKKSSDSGFVGNIGATKRTGLTTFRIEFKQDVAPSATGNQVEFDSIRIDIRRAITEKLTFQFLGDYIDTDTTDDSISRSDREFIRLRPGLTWRFLPSWVAEVYYAYLEEDRDFGGSGDSNNAFISISWSPPRQF